MFKEAIDASNIIEFVGQQPHGENNSMRIIVRVLNEAAWPKIMVKLLKQAVDDEDYYLQVMKEFYLDDAFQPKFAWVIAVEGDLELATQNLAPILSKRLNSLPTPPAYAKAVSATKPASAPTQPNPTNVQKRVIRGETEAYEETTVRLPFARGNRDRSPEEVVRVMDTKRGIRAAVRGVVG